MKEVISYKSTHIKVFMIFVMYYIWCNRKNKSK